jgi:hypothetical protein
MKIRSKKVTRLLVFGSRFWRNKDSIWWELSKYPKSTIVMHGDNGYDENGKALWKQEDRLAVRGTDKLAGAVARELGMRVIVFTPDWDLYGLTAGPMRNKEMARDGRPTEGLCFHPNLKTSRGSKGMSEILDLCKIPWRNIKK